MMARVSEKSKRIEKTKLLAPDLPPDTCPYIELVLNFVENETVCDDQRKKLIIDTLEYIRSANDSLRKSSKFWYDEFKKG
jgi:hypothetical protein